jgi:hypothetical protein
MVINIKYYDDETQTVCLLPRKGAKIFFERERVDATETTFHIKTLIYSSSEENA